MLKDNNTRKLEQFKNYSVYAEAKGLNLLQIKNASNLTCQFKSCGHSFTTSIVALKICKGKHPCVVCVESKIKQYCSEKDFILLERKVLSFILKCNVCKTTKKVELTNAKQNKFTCSVCFDNKLEQEAIASNLILLEKRPNGQGYYKAPCGCNLVLFYYRVRENSYYCPNCRDSHYNKQSYLYLFLMIPIDSKNNENFLKLGYSQNPNNRIKGYKLNNISGIFILKTIKIKSGLLACRIENKLHEKYKNLNLMSLDMQKYFLNSGFTECYPVHLQNILLNDLKNIEIEQNE